MVLHTQGATSVLSKAIPTIKANGKVKKWDLTVSYSFSGFNHDFGTAVDVEYLNKEPLDFTKAELFAFCNTAHWDSVFDSLYGSLTGFPTETRIDDFDITTLN